MAIVAKLLSGWHECVVVDYSPKGNVIKCVVKGDGTPIPCVWAAGTISGMLGLKTSYIPPLKTEVIVWWPPKGTIGWIMGCKPGIGIDPGQQVRTATGDPDADNTVHQVFQQGESKTDQVFIAHKPPVDLVEGDFHVENWLGVGMSLLRNLASIQAGDLARVECFVLDDLVRIISDSFKHYSAFGDYAITNDGGKLNVVWNGTSRDSEAWGLKDEHGARAKMTDPSTVTQGAAADNSDDGRWRFSQYIGWLGNFVHTFFTDPVEAMGRIAQDQFRSGKGHFHVNADGSIIAQTVADIVLEKVVRIPVPVPIRREDDPAGNKSDVAPPHPEFLKTWNPSDPSNLFEMAFQLREYARWLNNSYSLARFRQMAKDWQVPTEAQTPAPDINSGESDRKKQNAGVTNWQLAYSTIRIYRDGSIQTLDAYGNAVTTTKTGIQISTPKDLLLQAGGSVNIVAGRDVNVVAQKNVNLSAIHEALRLSSRSAMQFICIAGNMIYEVAIGSWHKIIGDVTINNTTSISRVGEIKAADSVTTSKLNAALSVNTKAVNAVSVYQSTPFNDTDSAGHQEANHTWKGDAPSVSLTLPAVTDVFKFQTDYEPGQLYQTITQQQLTKHDVGQLPSAGAILGASAGATTGLNASVAAAAAVVNKVIPGAVHPVTGKVNHAVVAAAGRAAATPSVLASSGTSVAGIVGGPAGAVAGIVGDATGAAAGVINTAGGGAASVVGKVESVGAAMVGGVVSSVTSAINGVTSEVASAAGAAGAAAASASKLLQVPNLHTPCELAPLLEAKIAGYIKDLGIKMSAPAIIDEAKQLIQSILNPLSNISIPSLGSLASYGLDLSIISDIQGIVSSALSTLTSTINGLLSEICLPSLPGLPTLPQVPSLDSLKTGALSSVDGVSQAAGQAAEDVYNANKFTA